MVGVSPTELARKWVPKAILAVDPTQVGSHSPSTRSHSPSASNDSPRVRNRTTDSILTQNNGRPRNVLAGLSREILGWRQVPGLPAKRKSRKKAWKTVSVRSLTHFICSPMRNDSPSTGNGTVLAFCCGMARLRRSTGEWLILAY